MTRLQGVERGRKEMTKEILAFWEKQTIHNNTWRCLFVRIQWVTIGYETILRMLTKTRRSHPAIWPSLCINQPTKVLFSWLLGHFNSSTVHSQFFVRHHLTSQDFHVYTIKQHKPKGVNNCYDTWTGIGENVLKPKKKEAGWSFGGIKIGHLWKSRPEFTCEFPY